MFRKALSRVGLALLGMIALGALCVWFVYVQLLQLDGENRRELSRAAREIGATLNELSATAARTLNVDGRLPGKEALDGFASEFSQRNPYIVDRESGDFDQQNRTIALTGDQCTDHRPGLVNPRILAVPARHAGATSPPRAAGESKSGAPAREPGSAGEAWTVYQFEATAERIFEDVFISRAFEHLFIADADGKVAFEMPHGASAERRADRGWLVQRGEGDSGRGRSTTRIENLKALETAPGKVLNLAVVAAASGAYRIYLGDRVYQLYAYPIRIATFPELPAGISSNCADETTWIVAGIVDPQRMQEEALTISPQWMLLVFLGFVAMVVGQPFVKLFFLKPTERFRSADAWLLLPSASVLLTLATILLVDIGTYSRFRSTAAGKMEQLAQQVEDNVVGELRDMRGMLVGFDRQLARNEPHVLERICEGERADIMNLLVLDEETNDLKLPRPRYPSMIQVFWVNPFGKQVFKASVVQRGTGRQTVIDREYFSEVKDARVWSFSDESEPSFFTQSLRSITTAELLTALSIRSSLSKKCFPDSEEAIVAVVTGVHPTSVERPLLPSGVSFAIIGANGAVLYHSDRRRILKENLFEEFNDPEKLQAAVHARTPQRFRTTYSRRPTEVFIKPFNGIPKAQWFIATLRDEQWLETANSEALLRATFWSVAASIPIFVVALPLLFAGKRWLPHLWPDATKESFYKLMAPVYASLLFVGLAASFALDGATLFWSSALFPVLVIAISGVTHVIWTRREGRAFADRVASHAIFQRDSLKNITYKDWYFVAIAALWACTAVVPATGMFRYSWTLEMAKFRSLEWNRVHQHTESWKAQDDFEWKRVMMLDRPGFLRLRRDHLDDYMPQRPVIPAARLRFERWLDNYVPLYNDVAERLRDQSPGMLKDPASSSGDDVLDAGVALTWQTLVGGVLVGLVAWQWLRYKDRHLLWSDLPAAPPTHDFKGLASEHRLLAIVTPSERARARLTKMFCACGPAARGRIEPQPAPVDTVAMPVHVKVDDFEQELLNPNRRPAILKTLEECAASGGRAVIICRVDPLLLLSPASRDTGELQDVRPPLAPSERERWLAVLEPFAVHSAAVEDADEEGMDWSENHELYFDSLWRYCSTPEKLTLVQVAQEGFANPHQESVVRGLTRKRLLKLDPNLKLMNQPFEKFVLRKASSIRLTALETPEGALGWRGIRWIMAFLVLAMLLFLATTQGAWFNSAAAVLAGVAAGLEAVSGALHAFNRSRQVMA